MAEAGSDEFTYHSERARGEALAAIAAENPKVAAIHVELATRHVRRLQSQCDGEAGAEAVPAATLPPSAETMRSR